MQGDVFHAPHLVSSDRVMRRQSQKIGKAVDGHVPQPPQTPHSDRNQQEDGQRPHQRGQRTFLTAPFEDNRQRRQTKQKIGRGLAQQAKADDKPQMPDPSLASLKITRQPQQRQSDDKLAQHIIIDRAHHAQVLRLKSDQRHHAQGDLRLMRPDAPANQITQTHHAGPQAHRQQTERSETAIGQPVDGGCQQIIERRLMIFVLNRIQTRELVRRESGRGQLFLIAALPVASLDFRTAAPLRDVDGIVVMRRFIGGLPGRRVNGEQSPSQQITEQDRGKQRFFETGGRHGFAFGSVHYDENAASDVK